MAEQRSINFNLGSFFSNPKEASEKFGANLRVLNLQSENVGFNVEENTNTTPTTVLPKSPSSPLIEDESEGVSVLTSEKKRKYIRNVRINYGVCIFLLINPLLPLGQEIKKAIQVADLQNADGEKLKKFFEAVNNTNNTVYFTNHAIIAALMIAVLIIAARYAYKTAKLKKADLPVDYTNIKLEEYKLLKNIGLASIFIGAMGLLEGSQFITDGITGLATSSSVNFADVSVLVIGLFLLPLMARALQAGLKVNKQLAPEPTQYIPL